MLKLAMILPLFLAASGIAHAAEQECPVAGYTVRWALGFCMFRFETDDEANPDVAHCFQSELASIDAGGDSENCEANRMYKTAICALRIEYERFEGTLSECLRAADTVPGVVSEGVG